jgi:hypothetical protein
VRSLIKQKLNHAKRFETVWSGLKGGSEAAHMDAHSPIDVMFGLVCHTADGAELATIHMQQHRTNAGQTPVSVREIHIAVGSQPPIRVDNVNISYVPNIALANLALLEAAI